jgi:hypothetical protein
MKPSHQNLESPAKPIAVAFRVGSTSFALSLIYETFDRAAQFVPSSLRRDLRSRDVPLLFVMTATRKLDDDGSTVMHYVSYG